jgi:hypothetical protein
MRRLFTALCRCLAGLLAPVSRGGTPPQGKRPFAPSLTGSIGGGHASASWSDPLMWWPHGGPTPDVCELKWDWTPGESKTAPVDTKVERMKYGDGEGI